MRARGRQGRRVPLIQRLGSLPIASRPSFLQKRFIIAAAELRPVRAGHRSHHLAPRCYPSVPDGAAALRLLARRAGRLDSASADKLWPAPSSQDLPLLDRGQWSSVGAIDYQAMDRAGNRSRRLTILRCRALAKPHLALVRSEEHTSELQSLMRISYAVFCLKKKKEQNTKHTKYA